MSNVQRERDVFARTMLALQPYAGDIVLIGGWVHALYIAESNSPSRAVHTTDIDFTIPSTLIAGDRSTLLDLVQVAGFEPELLDPASGVLRLTQEDGAGGLIDLDLLTDAPDPNVPVEIQGQPGLVVHGYPDQHVLMESSRWIEVGPDIHGRLDPPVRIRVPTLAAYVLVKGLSSARRLGPRKAAKDLVYLYEVIRDATLRRQVVAEMADLAARAPVEYAAWRAILSSSADNRAQMGAVAGQLEEQLRVPVGLADLPKHVSAHLRRLPSETPRRRRSGSWARKGPSSPSRGRSAAWGLLRDAGDLPGRVRYRGPGAPRKISRCPEDP